MPSSYRFVVDTNVFISAALSRHGKPNRAVRRVLIEGRLLASEVTFAELETRLHRSKFDKYVTDDDRVAYLKFIQARSHFVDVRERIQACRDPDDDKFLELAVSGRADAIVSGDGDLKALHPFRSISILSPATFLEMDLQQL